MEFLKLYPTWLELNVEDTRQKRAVEKNNSSQWDQYKSIPSPHPKFVALLAFASQGRLEIHLILVNGQTQLSNVPLFLVRTLSGVVHRYRKSPPRRQGHSWYFPHHHITLLYQSTLVVVTFSENLCVDAYIRLFITSSRVIMSKHLHFEMYIILYTYLHFSFLYIKGNIRISFFFFF